MVVVGLVGEWGVEEKLFVIWFVEGLLGDGIMGLGRVWEVEFLDDVMGEWGVREIRDRDGGWV